MSVTHFPNGLSSFGNVLAGPGGLLGVGNIYYVVSTSDTTVYNDLVLRYGGQTYENDGSSILHTSIATALAATVECRNDYVVVQPKNADYDITAALTLNKKNVHLVCPAGISYDIGSNNSVRIEQTTDSLAIFAISDAAIEVAGFYLKPDASASAAPFTLAATSYALNIHHNYIVLKGTVASGGASIAGTGDGGAWGNIERNHCITQVSSSTFPSVIGIASPATGCEVSHNQITIGNGATATVGISNGAVLGNTNYNTFSTCGGSGAASGGTITNCVAINASATAIGNRCAVASGGFASGGTAQNSF
jgi:hypothetical protein